MYHFIYITNLPSFYKINLLNRINEQRKILVVFTNYDTIPRNQDFFNAKIKFDHYTLRQRSLLSRAIVILRLIKQHPHKHLMVGGWDQVPFWIAMFASSKNRNALVLESTILECRLDGIRGLLKKLFVSRIARSFVPGQSQADLLKILGFKGEIIKTKGVGIFNIQKQPLFKQTPEVKNFLFIGRLSPEKNLKGLVELFCSLPDLKLQIIGFGPQEEQLKSIAGANIVFLGAVENRNLPQYFQQNDVLILPSFNETWGVVVEEALNNGLPVIASNKVGCASEIIENHGLVFNIEEPDSLKNALDKIKEPALYNQLRYNISRLDFDKVAEQQVNSYVKW